MSDNNGSNSNGSNGAGDTSKTLVGAPAPRNEHSGLNKRPGEYSMGRKELSGAHKMPEAPAPAPAAAPQLKPTERTIVNAPAEPVSTPRRDTLPRVDRASAPPVNS